MDGEGLLKLVFLVLTGGAVAALVIIMVHLQRKRRKKWSAAAAGLGFDYLPEDRRVPNHFMGWRTFSYGSHKRATNVLSGERRGVRVLTTDYEYSTGMGGTNRFHTRMTLCILRSPQLNLPAFSLRRQLTGAGLFAAGLGVNAVSTSEEVDFASAFVVEGVDELTSGRLFDADAQQRIMGYRNFNLHLEGKGDTLLVHFRVSIEPEASSQLIDQALDLMQAFVR